RAHAVRSTARAARKCRRRTTPQAAPSVVTTLRRDMVPKSTVVDNFALRGRLRFRSRLVGPVRTDLVAHAGEALPRGQVELPAVQLAGQDPVLDLAEAGQVRLQVRAAPLQYPVAHPDVLRVGLLLGVPALGVLQPLLRQALEERVDELVVLADPRRAEPAGQEQRVDPVHLFDVQQMLHEYPWRPEPVPHLLVGGAAALLAREVDQDRLHDGLPVLAREVEAPRPPHAGG